MGLFTSKVDVPIRDEIASRLVGDDDFSRKKAAENQEALAGALESDEEIQLIGVDHTVHKVVVAVTNQRLLVARKGKFLGGITPDDIQAHHLMQTQEHKWFCAIEVFGRQASKLDELIHWPRDSNRRLLSVYFLTKQEANEFSVSITNNLSASLVDSIRRKQSPRARAVMFRRPGRPGHGWLAAGTGCQGCRS